MSKKQDRLSLKDATKLTVRGYKFIYSKHPNLLISDGLFSIVSAITPYVGIYLMALIINEISTTRSQERLTTLIIISLVSAAVLALLNAILLRWSNYHRENFGWLKVNGLYTEKLLSLDYDKIDNPRTHDLLAQIRSNANMNWYGLPRLAMSFRAIINAITTIIGAIALSISLFRLPVPDDAGWLTILNSPFLVISVVILMFVITMLTPVFNSKSQSYWTKTSDKMLLMNRTLGFFGWHMKERKRALDVRIYRQDKITTHTFASSYNSEGGLGPKSALGKFARGSMGVFAAIGSGIAQIFIGVVYVFVCLKAWGGAFPIGSVTQYIAAITALSGGIARLFTELTLLRHNTHYLKTSFEFLDIKNDMYQGSLTVEKRSDLKYEIEFKNVSFKYPNTDNYVLKNVSIKFKVGERLAVVGMNGSGKTTFIKLLCRLYDPTEGEILLNGINIRKYDYHEYMSIFSIVFQDFKLLSLSLGQNIATGPQYDSEKALKCLEEAGFGVRLDKMPNSLETYLYKDFVEDGVEVSGGEAQKIALARALYKNAAFVVLDEPTAALDPIAEHEVYSKMN
ncbi:MAG: ABC transporter ATP-binding protein/permease, partial [Defluviitaleaceae bacterium]|nr:ABC transporter ATP-binding protein/permease [Defluviitaleaceae bacterium]